MNASGPQPPPTAAPAGAPSDRAARLTRYLPASAARRLAEDPRPRTGPAEQVVTGAVVFADISGFTRLAERLARRGPDGVEELSRALNAAFGRLAQVVDAHGGEVLAFAGDALVALWRAEASRDPVGAAAQCALAAQAAMTEEGASEAGQLSLRVVVGAGDVRLARVGGESGHWWFLALGPALDQVRAALPRARPGTVVLSPQAWALRSFVGEPLEAGHRRLLAVPDPGPVQPAAPAPVLDDLELLEALAPPPVVAGMAEGDGSWAAELRHVTALFVALSGVDAGAAPLHTVDAFARALQAVADRYEGTLKEVSADDKGVVGILVFGLAPRAHEDDRRRAAEAALDLRRRLADLGVASSVGVASGRAFCGPVETTSRSDYAVIGDVMNLAARLMLAASGDVYCDEATASAAQPHVRFEALPPVSVKGKVQPVAVWRPVGPADATATRPHVESPAPAHALVGRVAERARLGERLHGLLRGRGGLVRLEGEAGIGKSRLVAELVRMARDQGVRVAAGSGDAIDRSSPYQAWRGVLGELCGPELLDDPPALLQWTERHVAPGRDRQLLPLLGSLLPLGLPDNDITAQMAGAVRSDNTTSLVVRLLESVLAGEGRPLLVVLDDAQWLDSASWALAGAVARRLPQVLLVLAGRPWEEGAPPPEAAFLDGPEADRLVLGGLAPAEISALLADRLKASSVPEDVVELVVQRAEGNPFFSEELLDSLVREGLVVVSGGLARVAPAVGDLRARDLPETLEAVVMSRIDRLPPAVQLTLKVASVAGPSFSARLLEAVYPVEDGRDAVQSHLDDLSRLDLVTLESSQPEAVYRFRHAILRDVTYNLLLFAQRRRLHAAVAGWYEREEADDPVRRFALLAHHWAQADVPDKAAENLGQAGEQALRTGAYREARTFFGDALRLVDDSETLRRAGWERRLGEAELGLGRPVEARTHLRRAAALAGWPSPRTRVGLVLHLLSNLAVQVLSRLGLRRVVFRTRASSARNAEAAAANIRLVETYWFSNDTLALLDAGLSALNVAERAGPSADLARAYAIICVASANVRLHRMARLYARRSLQTAEQVGHLPTLAYCLVVTGVHAIGIGDWRRARQGLARALETFDELGDRRFAGNARALLGLVDNYQGHFSGSGQWYATLAADGERDGNVQHQLWGLTGQAVTAFRRGRTHESVRFLQQAAAILSDHPDPIEQFRLHGFFALVRLRRGETALALESVEAGYRAVPRRRSATSVTALQALWALNDTALALWEQGEATAAPDLARRAGAHLERFARLFPIARPRAWVDRGLVLWLSGRRKPAFRAWRAGLRAAEALEMPYELARAHYEIGRHLDRGDPARRQHLERAARLFEETGAVDDRARAEGALAGIG